MGIVGETGDSALIKLEVSDVLTVTVDHEGSSTTWTSINGFGGVTFSILSNWSKKLIPMVMTEEGIFVATVKMTFSEFHQFQIIKDEDEYQAIHPEMEYASLEQSKAMGPDHQGHGLYWYIEDCRPGSYVSIRLDLMQADRRKVVTWAEG